MLGKEAKAVSGSLSLTVSGDVIEVYGHTVGITPPTALILSKVFIQDRYRYDGADVNHIILKQADAIDWSLATWEGSRREQLRRWAALTLEEIIRAQEEMQELAERLAATPHSQD